MPAIDVFDSAIWSPDERQYFDAVDHACAGSKNMLIGNGNAKHAVFLMDRFLRSAQREIRLFSGSLVQNVPHEGNRSLDVYANAHLIESAATFLKRPGAALRILLDGDLDAPTPEEHPLIKRASQTDGTFTVGRVSGRWLDALCGADFLLHWMTVDDTGFRLERNTTDYTALANFRSKEHAKRLSGLFDRMAADATSIVCPQALLTTSPPVAILGTYTAIADGSQCREAASGTCFEAEG